MMVQIAEAPFFWKIILMYCIGLSGQIYGREKKEKIKRAVKCIIFKWTPLKSLTAH